jgi:hypothetical protein
MVSHWLRLLLRLLLLLHLTALLAVTLAVPLAVPLNSHNDLVFCHNKTDVLHVNLSATPSPFFDNFYIYKWTDKIVNNKTLINAYHIEIKDQDLRYFVGEQEDTMYEAW